MFRIGDSPDRKMQMIISRPGIARVADVTDGVAAMREDAFRDAVGVMIEMRVIKNGAIVRAELIKRDAAAFALKKSDDAPIGGGNDGRIVRRHDVNRIMHAPLRTGIIERIAQLFGTHADNGNQKFRVLHDGRPGGRCRC